MSRILPRGRHLFVGLALIGVAVLLTATHFPASASANEAPSPPTIPETVYRVDTADKVAFITIDDGIFTPENALAYVTRHQIPITAFLSAWTIKDSADYFTAMTRWGSVQAHSATHASFDLPATDLEHEICYVQRRYSKKYGWHPWMLRTPYGVASDSRKVRAVAASCGVQQIVMWDTVVDHGRVSFRGKKMQPGAIVLLHFSRDLKKDIHLAVKKIRAAGLVPANLADYLPDAMPPTIPQQLPGLQGPPFPGR
ncbi:MAG: polysaccharide deacetylase family protein [Candidatus Nanopelagicales bacterium]|nr:polysaccharide deacetylase family protein [Candidatus Nanopelagicales bacterium]MCF8539575.1 polysaccharide deacetylase family protein [Candidatus Nanopelagicales bacterium]MCF8550679.1 polysaccharide deacetylase family protein [Candidatus Nanopelagicales bacterium]